MILEYILIALGSALGGIFRYTCSSFVDSHLNSNFPYGTLFVNIVGSFIIGFFASFTISHKVIWGIIISKFFMLGFCGGFSTLSTFSIQTISLIKDHEFLKALLNIFLSFSLTILSAFLGQITYSTIK